MQYISTRWFEFNNIKDYYYFYHSGNTHANIFYNPILRDWYNGQRENSKVGSGGFYCQWFVLGGATPKPRVGVPPPHPPVPPPKNWLHTKKMILTPETWFWHKQTWFLHQKHIFYAKNKFLYTKSIFDIKTFSPN